MWLSQNLAIIGVLFALWFSVAECKSAHVIELDEGQFLTRRIDEQWCIFFYDPDCPHWYADDILRISIFSVLLLALFNLDAYLTCFSAKFSSTFTTFAKEAPHELNMARMNCVKYQTLCD